MTSRQPTAFFYLEEGAVDLHLHTQKLEAGGVEMDRLDYHEYVERRTTDEFEGVEPVQIYMLAETYLEEHPVNALKSGLTDERISRRIADELQHRKREGEDIGTDELAEALTDYTVTEIMEMDKFRERIAVQVGETSV
ncbi:MAG: hypothetical protein ABEJ91_01540 [Candidatus Nanohaloarchaea archaeon]